MLPKGIQIDDLCKIRSKLGGKRTLGVDAENKSNEFTAQSIASNLTIGLWPTVVFSIPKTLSW